MLLRCLVIEEESNILYDFHSGACGGHLSGYATMQKILRAGYFLPTLFRYCIIVVRKSQPCQLFSTKMHSNPTPLHHVVTFGLFSKWGIDLMYCTPVSAGGNHYIIIVVDYFTKWTDAMPEFANDSNTLAHFIFN